MLPKDPTLQLVHDPDPGTLYVPTLHSAAEALVDFKVLLLNLYLLQDIQSQLALVER